MARPSGGITAVKPPICLMYPKLQNDTGKRGYTNRIFLRGEAGIGLKRVYSVPSSGRPPFAHTRSRDFADEGQVSEVVAGSKVVPRP